MKFAPPVFAFLLSCSLLTSLEAQAATDAAKVQASEKQLKELLDGMKKIQGRLNEAKGEQGALQKELEKTDKRVADVDLQIRQLESEMAATQSKLDELVAKENEVQQQLNKQKKFLAEQLRAAYAMGDDHALKMLLNLDSIDEAARMATYYEYFNQASRERIDTVKVLLDELQKTRQQIDAENEILMAKREEVGQQKAQLEEARKAQKNALAKLNSQIKSDESKLAKMQADQKRLQKLIEEVQRAVADLPMPSDARSFKELRAKLSWPIRGKLLNQFGSRPEQGGLRSNGIFIGGNRGEAVHAVHHGRVVFADWLRGFGLLVIVDHGQGYMSLYGSNQAIYKQPGDWVNAGETIASVGNSGGQPESGLYFEIRHKGEPDNPLNWLKK